MQSLAGLCEQQPATDLQCRFDLRGAGAPQAWNALEFGKAGALQALPAAELHDEVLRQRDRIGAAGIAGKERRDQLGV